MGRGGKKRKTRLKNAGIRSPGFKPPGSGRLKEKREEKPASVRKWFQESRRIKGMEKRIVGKSPGSLLGRARSWLWKGGINRTKTKNERGSLLGERGLRAKTPESRRAKRVRRS